MGVASPAHGEVTLQAVGETWRLYMGVNALCDLEAEVSDPLELGRLFGTVEGEPSMSTVRAALWAALQEHHAGATSRDAGNLIAHLGLAPVGAKIGQAIAAAFPDAKSGDKARPRKAARKRA